jgi:hypothetical protein
MTRRLTLQHLTVPGLSLLLVGKSSQLVADVQVLRIARVGVTVWTSLHIKTGAGDLPRSASDISIPKKMRKLPSRWLTTLSLTELLAVVSMNGVNADRREVRWHGWSNSTLSWSWNVRRMWRLQAALPVQALSLLYRPVLPGPLVLHNLRV